MGESYPHLIAGFTGGLTSAVILQPFDLLKTRLQQSQLKKLLQIIRDLPSVKTLWTGTVPSVLRTSIGSSLYLTSLNITRSYIAKHSGGAVLSKSSKLPQLPMYQNLLTGAFARGAVGYLTMPITVVKTRYESDFYHYKSLGQAVRSIYKETNGIRGFFLGSGSTIARDAPYAGLYVLLYEKFKVSLGKYTGGQFQDVLTNSLSAMIAASTATTLTTPFDMIKTRIQIDPGHYGNFFQACRLIVRQENILRLFDGLSLRLVRKTLSAGIAWGLYEEILKLF